MYCGTNRKMIKKASVVKCTMALSKPDCKKVMIFVIPDISRKDPLSMNKRIIHNNSTRMPFIQRKRIREREDLE